MKTLNHTEMKEVNGGLAVSVIAALIGGGAALIGTIATLTIGLLNYFKK